MQPALLIHDRAFRQPHADLIKAGGAVLFYFARRYPEALREAQETLKMDANYVPPWRVPGSVHLQQGLYADAIRDLQQGLNIRSDSFCLGRFGYAYARAGRRNDAEAVLKRMLDVRARSYMPPYHIGVVYAGLNDLDQVFTWFDKAYDDRDPDLMMLKVEPLLDNVRADPRFTVLLRKMRLDG